MLQLMLDVVQVVKCERTASYGNFYSLPLVNFTAVVCNDVSEAEWLDAVKMTLESTWKTVFAAILWTIFGNS